MWYLVFFSNESNKFTTIYYHPNFSCQQISVEKENLVLFFYVKKFEAKFGGIEQNLNNNKVIYIYIYPIP